MSGQFNSMIDIVSPSSQKNAACYDESPIPPPQKAVPRTYPGAPSKDDDGIELPQRPSASRANSQPVTPISTRPPSPSELERSNPPSPAPGDGRSDEFVETFEPLQSMLDPYMNRWRLLCACLMNLANGVTDSSTGALIPYMETHYNIGYAVVSLLFVGQALGFIFGAFTLDAIRARLSRSHLLILSQSLLASAYILLAAGTPFGVLVMSFFFIGWGMSINLAMNNIFCGSLQSATTALGFFHGAYGIGGTVGPIIATAIATSLGGDMFYRFYFLPVGLAIVALFMSWWAFHSFEADNDRVDGVPLTGVRSAASAVAVKAQFLAMFRAIRLRMVLLGALFIFAYQGAEVSISGWVISFLMKNRDVGNPESVGYVTAGFWAGVTIGRLALSPMAQRVGERRFTYLVTAGAAVFQVLVWWVPNIYGGAVSLAIVGLLLGPIYPCSAAVFMRGMSKRQRGTGMVVISAFGSSGGAVAPFTTGLLAQAVGTWVLHPIALGLFACMVICWFFLPPEPKRRE